MEPPFPLVHKFYVRTIDTHVNPDYDDEPSWRVVHNKSKELLHGAYNKWNLYSLRSVGYTTRKRAYALHDSLPVELQKITIVASMPYYDRKH